MAKYFMNPNTGTVQTISDWRQDYIELRKADDLEMWFGVSEQPREQLEDMHWLYDADLVEVKLIKGEWVEV